MHIHPPSALLALGVLASCATADVITGIPDAAPAGFEEWVSPIIIPAKNITGDGGWASAVQKARAFVAQLTLEEKVNLTTGIGTNGRCVGNTGEVTRLGFKGFCLQDSPLGVRDTDFVSAFPAGIQVAATFDSSLMNQRGAAMGAEHRGKGVNVALGPMTNLGRVAAGGRNWEGFGADPFLAGVATGETVKGYQSQGVIACVKHLIGNEQEHFRGGSEAQQIYSSNIDDQTLHEVYSWPFAEAIQSGVGSIMCSYNKINQTQLCQNSKILNGLVKEELDFQGFITSDWAAMINGVQPALAGLDMNMPGFKAYGVGPVEPDPDNTTNSWWGSALIQSVNNGSVPLSRVDDMVTRTMAAFYKMGQDSGYPAVNFDYNSETSVLGGQVVNEHVNVQGDHYKLIREIGAAGTILLKNTNGALPLNIKNIKRIAIFGSDAGPNPDGPNGCSDRGCDQGTLAMGWGSGTANFPYLIDPLSAIQTFVHDQAPTIPIEAVLDDFNYAQVTTVGAEADVCLVFVNADSGEGYITVDGNAGDRTNITLWHGGEALIAAATSVCSNTIVVQHVVGPVLVEAWIDNANVTGVLHAGIPGQESGNALVDILFGAVNPSGRLPYTIAKQRADYPADVLYTSSMQTPQITYSEGLEIDYRHFDAQNITPRFEFGFGMSYSTFAYSGLSIHPGSRQRRSEKRGANKRRGTDTSVSDDAQSTAKSSTPTNPPTVPSSTSGPLPSTHPANVSITPPHNVSASTTPAPTNAPITNGTGNVPIANGTAGGPIANSTSTLSGNGTANATATVSAPPAYSSPAQTNPGGPASLFDTAWTVSYAVRNTGKVDGNEVSQVYLGFPSSAGQPPRVLRGFDRSMVKSGQTAFVSVPLRVKDISVWDVVKQKWVVPDGAFTVMVGSSSRNIHLTGTFTPSS
ncbi:glycoside hydrolase family 3 protein [Ramaria rubella]|nr:glycoside hydrolase family 3 protein [Ramaria rubella]